MKEIKIAVIAPKSFRGEEEYKNAQSAVTYVHEAARNGARLVCFPEGYPGPCTGPMDSGGHLSLSPIERMCECARLNEVYISCGNLEESEDAAGAYYLCHKLISPQGVILADYKRCQPTPPVLNGYLYGGRKHILPGNELIVVDSELGKIGLIICSELWVPEITRIEMLMGAEIVIDPIGGTHSRIRTQRYDSNGTTPQGSRMTIWHCLAQARCAENMVYVIGTSNIFFPEFPWGSFVVGPEGIIATSEGEAVIHAILDMDRLEYLRDIGYREEDFEPPPNNSIELRPRLCQPMQYHDRRPDLYSKLVEPQRDAFNYFYYVEGRENF